MCKTLSQPQPVQKSTINPILLQSLAVITDLSLAELRTALKGLGEDVPLHWTKVELRYRLEEVTGKNTSVNVKNKNTAETSPMQTMVKRLNTASRKKSDLLAFCTNELSLTNLENKDHCPAPDGGHEGHQRAHGSPRIGCGSFGKHFKATYQHIRDHEPQYAEWVKTTAVENPTSSDPRLRRLARWLCLQDDQELLPDKNQTPDFMTKFRSSEPKPKPATRRSNPPPVEGAASSSSTATQAQMQTMFEMIQSLKEEIGELKGQPQRKKGYRTEESGNETEGSFSVVHPKNPKSGSP
eukprot:s501_g9.t1